LKKWKELKSMMNKRVDVPVMQLYHRLFIYQDFNGGWVGEWKCETEMALYT
jgi:hypothetical protein